MQPHQTAGHRATRSNITNNIQQNSQNWSTTSSSAPSVSSPGLTSSSSDDTTSPYDRPGPPGHPPTPSLPLVTDTLVTDSLQWRETDSGTSDKEEGSGEEVEDGANTTQEQVKSVVDHFMGNPVKPGTADSFCPLTRSSPRCHLAWRGGALLLLPLNKLLGHSYVVN